ncbi:unnamed protein product, partial [Ectocarpus sp. 8 AP-2014]
PTLFQYKDLPVLVYLSTNPPWISLKAHPDTRAIGTYIRRGAAELGAEHVRRRHRSGTSTAHTRPSRTSTTTEEQKNKITKEQQPQRVTFRLAQTQNFNKQHRICT